MWSEVIEKSHAPSHPLLGGKQWAGEVTKVALVSEHLPHTHKGFYVVFSKKKLHELRYVKMGSSNIFHSTTVIAKIKGMPRSLFYVIPRYVTMDYEK